MGVRHRPGHCTAISSTRRASSPPRDRDCCENFLEIERFSRGVGPFAPDSGETESRRQSLQERAGFRIAIPGLNQHQTATLTKQGVRAVTGFRPGRGYSRAGRVGSPCWQKPPGAAGSPQGGGEADAQTALRRSGQESAVPQRTSRLVPMRDRMRQRTSRRESVGNSARM